MESSLEGNPVAETVRALPAMWTGTMTNLLDKVNENMTDAARRLPDCPKSARGLSGELDRLKPLLRRIGIQIHPPAGKGGGGAKGRQYSILRSSDSGTSSDGRDGPSVSGPATVPPKADENAPISADRDGRDGRDGLSGVLFSDVAPSAQGVVDAVEF